MLRVYFLKDSVIFFGFGLYSGAKRIYNWKSKCRHENV